MIKDFWRDFLKLFKKETPEVDYSATLEKLDDQKKHEEIDEDEIIKKYLLRKRGPIIFNFDYFCGCTAILRSKGLCLFFVILNVFSRIYDFILVFFNFAINYEFGSNHGRNFLIWFIWVFIEMIITFLAVYGLVKNYAKLQRWFILWRYIFSGITIFEACYHCAVMVHGEASKQRMFDYHGIIVIDLHEGDVYNREIVINNGTAEADHSLNFRFLISRLGQPITYFCFIVVTCFMEILILQNHYRFLRDRKGKSKGVIMDLVGDLTSCCRR